MNRILRIVLAFTFVVGLSNTCVRKILWACGGACGEGDGHGSHESGGYGVQTKAEVTGDKAEAVKDPVCGMEIGDIKKAPSEEYKGKVYYFCSEQCKKTFKKAPTSYIHTEGNEGENKH
jgi:YHS domain-containing protein